MDRLQKKGQPGASIKGRLLFISWIKVDGDVVYQAKPKEPTEHVAEQPAAAPDSFENGHHQADVKLEQPAEPQPPRRAAKRATKTK